MRNSLPDRAFSDFPCRIRDDGFPVPPAKCDMMALMGATLACNRNRVFEKAKAKGCYLPSYIGCRVTRYSDRVLGESNLIFSGIHLGPGGRLGNNNMTKSLSE